MKIVSLQDLYSKSDPKSRKKQKRLMEIACIDPAVRLCIRVANLDGLWECDKESILRMNHTSLSPSQDDEEQCGPVCVTEGVKVCCNERASDSNQYYLILNDASVNLHRVSDCGLTNYFPSAVIVMPDESVEDVRPNSAHGEEWVFVLCAQGKNNTKLYLDDYAEIPFCGDLLFVCVDFFSSEYREELVRIIPEVAEVPMFVKDKIKAFPRVYENMPERLGILILAYEKFWLNVQGSNSKVKDSIGNNVRLFLKKSFDELAVNISQDRKTGDKFLKFSIEMIEPRFVGHKSDDVSDDLYNGVPIKLWILIRAADFFWRDLSRSDTDTHPDGTHIERVLRCFGRGSYPFSKDVLASMNHKSVDIEPFEDAWRDYKRIMRRNPEIRYFPEVGFGSKADLAATAIRPSWARAKSSGGGSGSYGERKLKGQGKYIRITSGKYEDGSED